MFNHIPTKLETISRVETGKRFYQTPDGKRYPSITTVLGSVSDKSFLVKWRARIGEKEADKISKSSASRGTLNHQLWEKYLYNEAIDTEEMMPATRESFLQLTKIFDTSVENIRILEGKLISHLIKVGGTVDCVADFNKVTSIIDFKTSLREKKREWISGYFKQATAYSIMLEEMTGIRTEQVVICIQVQETGQPQIFIDDPLNWIDSLQEDINNYYKLYR